jgi:hypothetical protein
LTADEAGFDHTSRGAAIAILVVAVVTLFVDHEPIAALRGAGPSPALRLGATVRGTTVEGNGVAIVAGLGALLNAITAGRRRTTAGCSLTLEPHFQFAARRTAIAVCGVAIVAELTSSHHAVPTQGKGPASRAGRTQEPGFDRQAIGGAAVTIRGIAIVAGLILGERAIATGSREAFGDRKVEATAVPTFVRVEKTARTGIVLVSGAQGTAPLTRRFTRRRTAEPGRKDDQ